jgi:hypothetical protein
MRGVLAGDPERHVGPEVRDRATLQAGGRRADRRIEGQSSTVHDADQAIHDLFAGEVDVARGEGRCHVLRGECLDRLHRLVRGFAADRRRGLEAQEAVARLHGHGPVGRDQGARRIDGAAGQLPLHQLALSQGDGGERILRHRGEASAGVERDRGLQ